MAYPQWTVYIPGPAFLPFFPLSGHAYFGNGFFANMVLDVGDAAFDFRTVDFDSHVDLAQNKLINGEPLSAVIDAIDRTCAGSGSAAARSSCTPVGRIPWCRRGP